MKNKIHKDSAKADGKQVSQNSDPAYVPDTPEYWKRHAMRCEREGDWLMARVIHQRVRDAGNERKIERLGFDLGIMAKSERTALLVAALEMLPPIKRAWLKSKMQGSRQKMESKRYVVIISSRPENWKGVTS